MLDRRCKHINPVVNSTAPVQSHESTSYQIFHANFKYTAAPIILFFWFVIVAIAKTIFQNVKEWKKEGRPTIKSTLGASLRAVPESCILICMGLLVGAIDVLGGEMGWWVKDYLQCKLGMYFNSHTFFIFLLPPIIFEAGYTVPRKAFTMNMIEIYVYAVIGTLMNTFLVAGGIIEQFS